jgi:hypothetical protein
MTMNFKLISYFTALLENHVIPHPICLPAIIGEHKVRTLGSEKLKFDCDRKGITVEEKRLRSNFLMGQNGVLYMLDDLLLPDRGNPQEMPEKSNIINGSPSSFTYQRSVKFQFPVSKPFSFSNS